MASSSPFSESHPAHVRDDAMATLLSMLEYRLSGWERASYTQKRCHSRLRLCIFLCLDNPSVLTTKELEESDGFSESSTVIVCFGSAVMRLRRILR